MTIRMILLLLFATLLASSDAAPGATTEPSWAPTGRLSQFRGFATPKPHGTVPEDAQMMFSSVWAGWSAWSFCSNGARIRVRACNTVKGFSCLGPNQETRPCDSDPIPSRGGARSHSSPSDYDVVDPWEADRREAMKQLYPDDDEDEIQQREQQLPQNDVINSNLVHLHPKENALPAARALSAGRTRVAAPVSMIDHQLVGFEDRRPVNRLTGAPGADPEKVFGARQFPVDEPVKLDSHKERKHKGVGDSKGTKIIPSQSNEDDIVIVRPNEEVKEQSIKIRQESFTTEAPSPSTELPTVPPAPITTESTTVALTSAAPAEKTIILTKHESITLQDTSTTPPISTVSPTTPKPGSTPIVGQTTMKSINNTMSAFKMRKKAREHVRPAGFELEEKRLGDAILDALVEPAASPAFTTDTDKAAEVEEVEEEDDDGTPRFGSNPKRVHPQISSGGLDEQVADVVEMVAPTMATPPESPSANEQTVATPTFDDVTEAPVVVPQSERVSQAEAELAELMRIGSGFSAKRVSPRKEKKKGFGLTGFGASKSRGGADRTTALHYGEVTTAAAPQWKNSKPLTEATPLFAENTPAQSNAQPAFGNNAPLFEDVAQDVTQDTESISSDFPFAAFDEAAAAPAEQSQDIATGEPAELSPDTLNALDWMLQNMTQAAASEDQQFLNGLDTNGAPVGGVTGNEVDVLASRSIDDAAWPAEDVPKKTSKSKKSKKLGKSRKRKGKKDAAQVKLHSGEFKPFNFDPSKMFPKFRSRTVYQTRARALGVRTVNEDRAERTTTEMSYPGRDEQRAGDEDPEALVEEINKLQAMMKEMETKIDTISSAEVALSNLPESFVLRERDQHVHDNQLKVDETKGAYTKKKSAKDISLVPESPIQETWPQNDERLRIISSDYDDSATSGAVWSKWSNWGDCFCGKQLRTRSCVFGRASNGCAGISHESRECTGGVCPTTAAPREASTERNSQENVYFSAIDRQRPIRPRRLISPTLP